MEGYDVVMDGTQITLNGKSTECIAPRRGVTESISTVSVTRTSGTTCS